MKFICWMFKIIVIGVLLVCGIYGYSKYIEPKLLVVNKYDVSSSTLTSRTMNREFKIAQFSDTHIGEFYSLEQLEKLVDKINEQKPDIVVFTGDLIDIAREFDQIHEIADILKKIEAPYGKFAVWGNHDYGGGAQWHYPEILAEADFKLLTNEVEFIEVSEDLTLSISGLDEVMLGHPNISAITDQLSSDDYNILLFHEPDLIDNFANSNVDLALGGHSHGGQVQLPFIGPLVTTAYGEKYFDGWYNINEESNLRLYVNTGIGNTKLPYRFLNVPEVAIFKINY